MNRDELIEKALKFMTLHERPDAVKEAAETLADFALSLQEPEVKPWPQEGDTYYWFDHHDGRYESIWDDDVLDRARQSFGIIFKTEEERDCAVRRIQANAEIRRWRDENCPFVPDWGDKEQKKYHGIYGSDDKEWTYDWFTTAHVPNVIYFASPDDLKRCQSAIPDAWDTLVGVK